MKTLKLTTTDKRVLSNLREKYNETIDQYSHLMDEEIQMLIDEGFFEDFADYLAWQAFITNDLHIKSKTQSGVKKLMQIGLL